jgi:hypothetical protein
MARAVECHAQVMSVRYGEKISGWGKASGRVTMLSALPLVGLLVVRYLTLYSTKLFTLVELSMIFRTRLFALPLTRLM